MNLYRITPINGHLYLGNWIDYSHKRINENSIIVFGIAEDKILFNNITYKLLVGYIEEIRT